MHFRICLFTALIAILCLSSTSYAGQRAEAFSLSPMTGYHGFEGDQNTDDGWFGGLSLGYNLTRHWASELEVRYTDTELDLGGGGPDDDLEIWSIGINALYHFNPDGPLVPYVSAGFGIMYFDVDSDNDAFDYDDDYMMNWGVGAKYFFQEDLALRTDLRHVVDFHSDRNFDHPSGDDTDHNYLASLGLYWQFGGPEPPPPPPVDSDGDGIADMRDKCPDTPLGVMVDAVGCPPSKKAPPPPPTPQKPVEKPAPVVEKEVLTFNLVFGFDRHQITDEMIPVLEQVKAILDEDPEASFLVSGHTCSIGPDGYNQKLSERRASSVKNWLMDNGIATYRLEATGYGETQPRYDNNTKEGRKLNRRVEIMTHEQ